MQKNYHPTLSYRDLYSKHLEIVELLDRAGMDY